MTTEFFAVIVDLENNAEEWWTALRAAYPQLAAALEKNDCAVITQPVWDAVAALPGFFDGSAYARTALIDCGNTGEPWTDIVGGAHQVFEEAC